METNNERFGVRMISKRKYHLSIILLQLHDFWSHVEWGTTQGFCKAPRLQRSAQEGNCALITKLQNGV